MTHAFHSLTAEDDIPLFIFGDHASRHIPAEFSGLGLTEPDLTRHIAWDIGTKTIIQHLCAHFGCAGHIAGVSRLVIDINRDPQADSLIPRTSDGTIIPGNQGLTAAQRQDRIDRFYAPYHAALSTAIDRMDNPLILSIHSFTDKPLTGAQRETEIGLLAKHDMTSAEQFQATMLQMAPRFNVAMNKPYSAHDLNYTIDTHIAPRGLRHLAIEIRQDLIDTAEDAVSIANILAKNIHPLIHQSVKIPA